MQRRATARGLAPLAAPHYDRAQQGGERPMSQSRKEVRAAPEELRVPVAPGVTLHVEQRRGDPAALPFMLVHGLASNLRLWDGVADELHGRGHTVVAVDQRGHGRSDAPESAYDMDIAVGDLLAVVEALGLSRPVLAGQSWGGNVVLELGWRHPTAVRGISCVDGGVIELVESFPSWEACLAALTPPRLDHLTAAELEKRMRVHSPELPDTAIAAALACFRIREDGFVEPRLSLHRHLQILRSLWDHRPSTRYATLAAATLLILADTGDQIRTEAKRRAEARALATAPRLRSHWFSPAHHDVHAQYPDRVAEVLSRAVREGFFG
jgi:pimeloyl-ACP methyl ester carboxylesterase